ncbi:MAG: hypothetical protein J1F05_07900 [Muribaculaceae bacterium]|nr:hypothetical protein [Muribaculaceae bacterium]
MRPERDWHEGIADSLKGRPIYFTTHNGSPTGTGGRVIIPQPPRHSARLGFLALQATSSIFLTSALRAFFSRQM